MLVDADIREQPQDYMVAEPDANIDFRRVRNLKVFFSHTAAALTTDVSEIEEWQGGDVVIFERHIGIVSDRRNKNGVPYIIHHNDPWQAAYEQDILEKRTDIVDITGYLHKSRKSGPAALSIQQCGGAAYFIGGVSVQETSLRLALAGAAEQLDLLLALGLDGLCAGSQQLAGSKPLPC